MVCGNLLSVCPPVTELVLLILWTKCWQCLRDLGSAHRPVWLRNGPLNIATKQQSFITSQGFTQYIPERVQSVIQLRGLGCCMLLQIVSLT